MTRQHVLWTVPLVAALALYFVEQHRREAERLAGLRSELGALSRTVAEPRAASPSAAEPRHAPPTPTPSAPARPADTPAGAAEVPEPPPLSNVELRQQFELSFTKQAADAGALEAQRAIEGRLAAILPATSKLQAVECRSAMCRIETAHQGPEAYQAFVQAAFMTPETRLGDGGMFSTVAGVPANGRVVTVSYLARDGDQLPMLAELH